MLVALALRGEPVAAVPLVLMAATVIAETALLSRLLASLEPGVTVTALSGPRSGPANAASTDIDPGLAAVGTSQGPNRPPR